MEDEDLSAWAQMGREINKYPVLSFEQEQELVACFGTEREAEAIKTLLNSNLRLVMYIVHDVAKRHQISPLDTDRRMDMFSAGLQALWRCLPKYDPSRLNEHGRPNKVSTYAYKWVEREVTKEARTNGHLIRSLDQQVLSLDKELGGDDDGTLYDVLPDENADEIVVEENHDWHELARYLLKKTNDRRLTHMMLMRFGIIDGKIRTLEEVGREFGKGPHYEKLTRESIRQLEERFYTIMKQDPRIKAWLDERARG